MFRWLWRFQEEASEPWPDGLRRYMAQRTRVTRRRPIHEARFVVFDTETSGLDVATCRLLSIAAVVVFNEEIHLSETFEALATQTEVGGASAAVVHGLVPSDLEDGQPEGLVAADFLEFAGNAVLVGHHVRFDIEVVNRAIHPFKGASIWNPTLDTATLAHRLERGPVDNGMGTGPESLDDLLERYNVSVDGRHTASGDALATAHLLLSLLKVAKRRGIRSLGHLLR